MFSIQEKVLQQIFSMNLSLIWAQLADELNEVHENGLYLC